MIYFLGLVQIGHKKPTSVDDLAVTANRNLFDKSDRL